MLLGSALALLLLFLGLGTVRGPSPEASVPTRGCAGKPAPAVGAVEAVVVERPAPGRAVVEVRWQRGPRGDDPSVDLLLPEGAYLIRGQRLHSLSRSAGEGVLRYEVGYDPDDGAPLDVVARLRAETGGRRSAREACVRLAE
jgi:hypothetical protein